MRGRIEPSDNSDAFDRLRIWEGYTCAYAPKLLVGLTIDNPGPNDRSTPLKFRILEGIKMGGAFQFCCDVRKWPQADLDFAKKMIDYYKTIRRTLQEGDLYRLASLREGNLAEAEYVAADGKQAVLFAFLHSQQFLYQAPTIYLRGLDEAALYRLKPIDDKLVEKQQILSGSYLMNHGLDFNLVGAHQFCWRGWSSPWSEKSAYLCLEGGRGYKPHRKVAWRSPPCLGWQRVGLPHPWRLAFN
jgi:alpha-galactosidase